MTQTETTTTAHIHEFTTSGCRYQWTSDHDQAECYEAFEKVSAR